LCNIVTRRKSCRVKKIPSSGEWLHEIEHDGFQKLYSRPEMIQTESLSLAKPTCYRNFPT